MLQRSSGILLHISSLPSDGGIGDFGPAAYAFVDFLKQSGQKYWQILPLNPTEPVYGNCPYSSPSAFALNTLFISPHALAEEGLLKIDEVKALPEFPDSCRVDYQSITTLKNNLLDQAYARFRDSKLENGEFQKFCEEHALWVDAYSEFMIFKKRFNGALWSDWPVDIRTRQPSILKEFRAKFSDDIKRVKFRQFIVFRQWDRLKKYALQNNVAFIGDIPIYVNEDSADVWANPEIFKLDMQMKPVFVAGVPPDYFSKTGQRWGNPVYDWDKIKATGYEWWTKRIGHNFKLFDVIRIDHFRGIMGFWEIPAAEKTAVNGHWTAGPGEHFLTHVRSAYPDMPIIAEDLGVITPDVSEAIKKFGLPGMKVLHFAFGGDPRHPYLPENFEDQCVVYTGTHDNNTTRGWFRKDANQNEKIFLEKYLGKKTSEVEIASDLITLALKSRAVMAIVPMQDVLNLGEESRMNIPGTVLGNWEWRLKKSEITTALAVHLAGSACLYQR